MTGSATGIGSDDLLLGQPLPHQGPGPPARVAARLADAADRYGRLAVRLRALGPTAAWSGTAAAAADRRLAGCAEVLALEQVRARRAAAALDEFARRVARAQQLADEARRLVAAAREAQRRADLAEPATARQRDAAASGRRIDGGLYDPAAVALLHRAREETVAACREHDGAVDQLVVRLTGLSGLRVRRRYGDLHLALDVLTLAPVVGDALGRVVDAYDIGTGIHDGDWEQVAVTAVTAVPGPVGKVATVVGIGVTVSRLGSVAGIDRVPPLVPVVRARRAEAAPAARAP